MTNINDSFKWNKFVAALLESTRDGSLIWADWTDKISRENALSGLFVAHHKEWSILIYRKSYKHFFEESQFEWADDVVMEVVDTEGNTLWLVPKTASSHKLLDYIQFKKANVDRLFKEIVGETVDESS